MNISFVEKGDKVVFRVSNFSPEYHDVFKSCFYNFDGDSYIKEFRRDIADIDKIMTNYSKYAEEMFSQVGYMKPIPWEKALLTFIKKVEGTNIDWWLTGSCAACIRGVHLNPHDIDIMLHSKDLDIIKEVFIDNIIEPIIFTNGWVANFFGVAFLEARVDLAFDPQECIDDPEPVDCGPYAMKHLEEITWHGYKIKVPSLDLQLSANKRRGRIERVNAIQRFIEESK